MFTAQPSEGLLDEHDEWCWIACLHDTPPNERDDESITGPVKDEGSLIIAKPKCDPADVLAELFTKPSKERIA